MYSLLDGRPTTTWRALLILLFEPGVELYVSVGVSIVNMEPRFALAAHSSIPGRISGPLRSWLAQIGMPSIKVDMGVLGMVPDETASSRSHSEGDFRIRTRWEPFGGTFCNE